MKRLLRFLDRFNDQVTVELLDPYYLDQAIQMMERCLAELGLHPDYSARNRIREHLLELLDGYPGTSAVWVTRLGSQLTGIVCCQLGAPDIWDGVRSMHAWCLYVRPEHRYHPKYAIGLMRKVVDCGLLWEAGRFRVEIDDATRHLIDRYTEVLGFREEIVCRTYILEAKGN